MTDLSEAIKNNNIVLFMVAKEEYHEKNLEAIKTVKESGKICYICLNEPYVLVSDKFKKNGIPVENLFFIDTLTKSVQTPPEADNCSFVSSPNSLTEIGLAFSKALNEQGCKTAIFDTLSSLLIYENAHMIIQFIHSIITKVRVVSGKAILIALKEDLDSELIKDLYMFVDKVIEA